MATLTLTLTVPTLTRPTWPTWPALAPVPAAPVPTPADLAATLARVITPAMALALAVVALVWQAGYAVGATLHSANDRLATLARVALAPAPVVTPTPAPVVTPTPALTHPLADLAADLATLPAAALRDLAGTRRRLSRDQLLSLALAMPL